MKTLKLWIARDKDGTLSLYYKKPIREDSYYERGTYCSGYFYGECASMYLKNDDFPSVKWENSPQQVELKLVNDE